MASIRLPCQGHPNYWHNPGVELTGKVSPTNPHIPSPVYLHILTRWLPTTPELHKTCLRFEVDNNKKND